METKLNRFYEAPSTEVIEVAQEGVVCASQEGAPKFYKPFNEEEEW